jgi:hypothetical protein
MADDLLPLLTFADAPSLDQWLYEHGVRQALGFVSQLGVRWRRPLASQTRSTASWRMT